MIYTIDNQTYPVDIIRKNNKNTYLRVHDGRIIITTNRFVTNNQITKLLEDNTTSLKRMLTKDEKRTKKEQDHTFYLWGHPHDIIYGFDKTTIEGYKIYTKDSQTLTKYLTKYCQEHFQAILDLWYNKFDENIPPPRLRLRKMKTRWGVCNTKTKVITLNTELLKYSEDCLEYVVIHELSHLIHPNHSKAFWAVVAKYCPNYKTIRKKLRE